MRLRGATDPDALDDGGQVVAVAPLGVRICLRGGKLAVGTHPLQALDMVRGLCVEVEQALLQHAFCEALEQLDAPSASRRLLHCPLVQLHDSALHQKLQPATELPKERRAWRRGHLLLLVDAVLQESSVLSGGAANEDILISFNFNTQCQVFCNAEMILPYKYVKSMQQKSMRISSHL